MRGRCRHLHVGEVSYVRDRGENVLYTPYLLNVEHVRPRTGCPSLSLSSTHLDRGFRSVLRVASAIHHSVGTSASDGNCFARSSMTSSMTSVGVCQLVPSGTLRSMRKWKWARSHISSWSFPGQGIGLYLVIRSILPTQQ